MQSTEHLSASRYVFGRFASGKDRTTRTRS
jgi:hypothetical protein